MANYVPVQEVPSPLYPVLQEQVNEPPVFVHFASAAQLCPPFSPMHSLKSEMV